MEAHYAIAVAMNRLGGKSNTGEGGEDAERSNILPNGDTVSLSFFLTRKTRRWKVPAHLRFVLGYADEISHQADRFRSIRSHLELPRRRYVPSRSSSRCDARRKLISFSPSRVVPPTADELQIKMAQGAKPGEGGELPGYKVSQSIARTRHSTAG